MNVVKLAGIALIVALAITLGVGGKAAEAQTLFGLAHSGPDGLSTLYRINSATGGFDPVGSGTGFQRCSGMDFRAGTLFATCERASDNTHVLIMIDPTSGAGGEVGPTGVGSGTLISLIKTASDISFRNSDGVLYAHLTPVTSLWTMSVTGGSIELVRETFLGGSGNGIAFSPEDELFHADGKSLNTLDQTDGSVTFVADLVFPDKCSSNCRVNAMDFLPGTEPGTETLFASVNDRSPGVGERPHKNFLATVNTTTGDVTIIGEGETVKGLDAIAFAPAATAAGAELGDFKCYGVKRPKGTPKFEEVEITLDDEFDSQITRVKKPESICVPVSKDGSEIADATPSLTCYKIKDVKGQPKFQQLDVVVENELYKGQALTLKKAKVICVPSTIVVVP